MALIRLVNTSVLSDNKTLLPWSIIRLNNESHTIEEFYKECVEFRLEGASFQISSAYVGHDRNILDSVELSLPILSVVSSFGLYLRYLVVSCSPDVAPVATYIRLSEDVFKQLRHLPHLTPGDDGHYLPFNEVFGMTTSEEHRPSFKKKKEVQRKSNHQKNSLPFYGSVQHVKNSQLMVQCDECSMWRLIFAKHKLTKDQRSELQLILRDNVYTCGSKLQDLELRDEFREVEVRDHACYDVIEKLYYSANYDPICIYCGKDEPFSSPSYYPLCNDCSHGGKTLVPK